MPALQLMSQCEVCRAVGDARLCRDCTDRWAAPVPRCRRCALRLPAGADVCGACLRDQPPFEHACCAADYAFPWDRLIAAFKFHGQTDLAPALATLLARAAIDAPRPDLLLPVPLSARRIAERGYNQAWELARRVARLLGLRAHASLLLRARDTRHQADLKRSERLANLRAAFAVEAGARSALRGRRVALVDDVLTTGATLREAAATLLAAGAGAVDVWVLARTPDD